MYFGGKRIVLAHKQNNRHNYENIILKNEIIWTSLVILIYLLE